MYDEALWDKTENIRAWTSISNIKICPICEEEDSFEIVKEEIIYIEEDTIDRIEQEHFIEAERKDWYITICIWKNEHPMWPDHKIVWVGLYDEYWDLLDEIFLWDDDDLVVDFEDYDLDEFEVRVWCSKHKLFWRKFKLE
jgi:desulfoferrodoxin (superoxide reductase-like protein)